VTRVLTDASGKEGDRRRVCRSRWRKAHSAGERRGVRTWARRIRGCWLNSARTSIPTPRQCERLVGKYIHDAFHGRHECDVRRRSGRRQRHIGGQFMSYERYSKTAHPVPSARPCWSAAVRQGGGLTGLHNARPDCSASNSRLHETRGQGIHAFHRGLQSNEDREPRRTRDGEGRVSACRSPPHRPQLRR